jgi:hypothetical protein
MKLNIKTSEILTSDKSNATTDKFFSAMGLKKESDTDKKSFSFAGKKKTIADLKGKKSIMQESSELTLDKFDKIEQLTKKIFNLDTSFNEFLSNQNESIKTIASFNDKLDSLEVLVLNSIKNQKSILNAVNSLHAKAFQSDTIEPDTDISKPVTKLRKKDNDEVSDYYDTFQGFFAGNFLGEKNLTDDIKPVFLALLESIDDSTPDTIESSIKNFRSEYSKHSNGKLLTARKSNDKMIKAMIKTIAKMQDKTFDLTNTTQNSETIDKNHFVDLLGISLESINDIISDLMEYGKVNTHFIEAVSEHLNEVNPNLTDHAIGTFIKYLKSYV